VLDEQHADKVITCWIIQISQCYAMQCVDLGLLFVSAGRFLFVFFTPLALAVRNNLWIQIVVLFLIASNAIGCGVGSILFEENIDFLMCVDHYDEVVSYNYTKFSLVFSFVTSGADVILNVVVYCKNWQRSRKFATNIQGKSFEKRRLNSIVSMAISLLSRRDEIH